MSTVTEVASIRGTDGVPDHAGGEDSLFSPTRPAHTATASPGIIGRSPLERTLQALPEIRGTRTVLSVELRRLPAYEKACRKLFAVHEQMRAELEIAADPTAWPVIPGTGGVRKARAARGGRGKSGGARILYYVLTVQEDIDADQKKSIRALVATLQREADG